LLGTAYWLSLHGATLDEKRGFLPCSSTDCLIGSAIEWGKILGEQGRWFVGLLWIVGAAVAILVARNRRTTIIVGLHGLVALLAVGAVAQRSYPGLIVASICGLLLFSIEKFWKHGTGKEARNEENPWERCES
jgi:hypothetical protein